jgi:FMN phosphatase YigB (HAD superfamily)
MVLLVFDLDDTLLSSHYFKKIERELPFNQVWANSSVYVYKKYIPKDIRLQELLQGSSYPKFIATNATIQHLLAGTSALGIDSYFQDMQYRNEYQKPSPEYYDLTTKMLEIYCQKKNIYLSKERIIFFDDLKENHVVPKLKLWVTVWISPSKDRKPDYVDYKYQNIYEALTDINRSCLTSTTLGQCS